MHGNQVVLADEDGYLAGDGHAHLGAEQGKMEHNEEIVLVLINFGTLSSAQTVVQVQRMKMVVLGQIVGLTGRRLLDVYPG